MAKIVRSNADEFIKNQYDPSWRRETIEHWVKLTTQTKFVPYGIAREVRMLANSYYHSRSLVENQKTITQYLEGADVEGIRLNFENLLAWIKFLDNGLYQRLHKQRDDFIESISILDHKDLARINEIRGALDCVCDAKYGVSDSVLVPPYAQVIGYGALCLNEHTTLDIIAGNPKETEILYQTLKRSVETGDLLGEPMKDISLKGNLEESGIGKHSFFEQIGRGSYLWLSVFYDGTYLKGGSKGYPRDLLSIESVGFPCNNPALHFLRIQTSTNLDKVSRVEVYQKLFERLKETSFVLTSVEALLAYHIVEK